jgi:type I restriction enzyme, S subunit
LKGFENSKGYKQTEVGLIPEDWEVKAIGEISISFSGGTPNTENRAYYGGPINFISSGDLNKVKIKDVDGRITKLGLENSAAKVVKENTFLIAMYGATAGVSAITEIEGAINQAILAIIPFEADNQFIHFWWSLNKDSLVRVLTQGGQPNLSGNLIKSVKIPYPSPSEQKVIADTISVCVEEIEILLTKLQKLKLQKQGMMQALLTGKIRLV